MYSISFPNMFTSGTTILKADKEAIRSNMLLLLSSERDTLFGDPYFGASLRKYIYEQSNSIIVDILIDELYTTIVTFMPQVVISRNDIKILTSGTSLFAEIKYYYAVDNTSDLFTIQLTTGTAES